MSRLGNALWGGGVFAVVFVGAWLVLTYMDLAKNRSMEMAQAGGPKEQALAVFADARMRTAPGQRIEPGDARYKEVELRILKAKGIEVSDEMIAQLREDAPTEPNQIKVAELPGEEGGRLVCASMRIQGRAVHFATTYLPNIILNPEEAMLPEYIDSGCAKAIRDRSRLMTATEYAQAVIASLPAGRRYASIRKDFEDMAAGR